MNIPTMNSEVILPIHAKMIISTKPDITYVGVSDQDIMELYTPMDHRYGLSTPTGSFYKPSVFVSGNTSYASEVYEHRLSLHKVQLTNTQYMYHDHMRCYCVTPEEVMGEYFNSAVITSLVNTLFPPWDTNGNCISQLYPIKVVAEMFSEDDIENYYDSIMIHSIHLPNGDVFTNGSIEVGMNLYNIIRDKNGDWGHCNLSDMIRRRTKWKSLTKSDHL